MLLDAVAQPVGEQDYKRSAANGRPSAKLPVRQAHPHVVHELVGEAVGDGNPRERVYERQRKDTAIGPEHLGEEQAAQQRHDGQRKVGQVRQRKQGRTGKNRGSCSQQDFKPHVEKRQQQKLLAD